MFGRGPMVLGSGGPVLYYFVTVNVYLVGKSEFRNFPFFSDIVSTNSRLVSVPLGVYGFSKLVCCVSSLRYLALYAIWCQISFNLIDTIPLASKYS